MKAEYYNRFGGPAVLVHGDLPEHRHGLGKIVLIPDAQL
jgi:hypothetical protein